MNKMNAGFIFCTLLFFLSACAIEPDESGNCPLSCDKAAPLSRIVDNGGVQVVNAVLLTPTGESTIWCTPAGASDPLDPEAATQPTRAQFKFTRKVKSFPFKGKAGDEEEEELRLAEPAQVDAEVPLAGVSFTPIVSGTVSAPHTDPSVATYDSATGKTDPAHLAGIITPRDEWCTDACGIATIEVWVKCIPSGGVSIYLNSGPLTPDKALDITWPEEEDASLHKLGIQVIRKYAYGTLPTRTPSFLQIPSFDLNPSNQFGELPWVEHRSFAEQKIEVKSHPARASSPRAANKRWN